MNQLQLDDVKKALDLSSKIDDLEERQEQIQDQHFREEPSAPIHERIGKQYPPIKLTMKKDYTILDWMITFIPWIVIVATLISDGMLFNSDGTGIALLFGLLVFSAIPQLIWMLIYRFSIWGRIKESSIAKSSKYKKQCAEIDREVAERQAEADAKYDAEMQEYNEVIMPQYQQEKAEWNARKKDTLDKIRKALDYFNNELSQHYQLTKIVPLNYRNTHTLSEIYTIMANSAYDVDRAIDIYDRNEQRKLDEARLREQQRANRLADEQNRLAYEQNQLLDEQNSIAEEARRDANRAATVAAIQRHNTNKALKNLRK